MEQFLEITREIERRFMKFGGKYKHSKYFLYLHISNIMFEFHSILESQLNDNILTLPISATPINVKLLEISQNEVILKYNFIIELLNHLGIKLSYNKQYFSLMATVASINHLKTVIQLLQQFGTYFFCMACIWIDIDRIMHFDEAKLY